MLKRPLFFLKELTLDQLLHALDAEECSDAPVLRKEESATQSEVRLIEEISSTETPEQPSTPVYEMVTVKDAKQKPLKIELKIELPKVSSVSECDVSVSKVTQHRVALCFLPSIQFLEILTANPLSKLIRYFNFLDLG